MAMNIASYQVDINREFNKAWWQQKVQLGFPSIDDWVVWQDHFSKGPRRETGVAIQ